MCTLVVAMGANIVGVFDRRTVLRREASTTQRRAKLAFRPLASATAALETPGSRQAAMTLPFAYTGSDMQKHSKPKVSAFSIDKFKKAWKT